MPSAFTRSGGRRNGSSDDWRVRHSRRNSSAAEFQGREGIHLHRLRSPGYIETLNKSTAIADHVRVDFELRGCPINKDQLLEVIQAFLASAANRTRQAYSVCMECKRRGTVCVMVAHGTPCLGPVTHDGCGAICPSYARGCYGCFGPKETPNTDSLTAWCERQRNEGPGHRASSSNF